MLLEQGYEVVGGEVCAKQIPVALGVESSTDADQVVTEGVPPDAADEWLFNAVDSDGTPADDATDAAKWNGTPAQPNKLYYVRVTTLARTDRPDPKYLSPPITNIEDHAYNEPAIPNNQADVNLRRFRRRLLTTIIDLRNVS